MLIRTISTPNVFNTASENSPLSRVTSPTRNASLRLVRLVSSSSSTVTSLRIPLSILRSTPSNATGSPTKQTDVFESKTWSTPLVQNKAPITENLQSWESEPLPPRTTTVSSYDIKIPSKKRMLEWACDRQSKRRRESGGRRPDASTPAHVDPTDGGCEDATNCDNDFESYDDNDRLYRYTLTPNNAGHASESALSLLSLACSHADCSIATQLDISRDVLCGASLLLGYKYSMPAPNLKLELID